MADYIGQNLFIRPQRIVSLPEFSGGFQFRSFAQKFAEKNLKKTSHGGILSTKATANLETAINWLLTAAEPKKVYHKKWNKYFTFKVNFCTLTLPDTACVISNTDLQKKLLNPFLTVLREYHGLKSYVWKLEFQQNGKLHVHFCSDTFIHHATLRSCWNSVLCKNNYMIDFYKKFGHSNPNSTDVHSVKKINNLAAYICKYMSKQSEDLKKIKGRIWGCSQNISKALHTRLFIDRDMCQEILKPLLLSKIEWKALGSIDTYTKQWRTFGEVFFLKYQNWVNDLRGPIKQKFQEIIYEIRGMIEVNNPVFQV